MTKDFKVTVRDQGDDWVDVMIEHLAHKTGAGDPDIGSYPRVLAVTKGDVDGAIAAEIEAIKSNL